SLPRHAPLMFGDAGRLGSWTVTHPSSMSNPPGAAIAIAGTMPSAPTADGTGGTAGPWITRSSAGATVVTIRGGSDGNTTETNAPGSIATTARPLGSGITVSITVPSTRCDSTLASGSGRSPDSQITVVVIA